jgi:hypothetical protein
VKAMSEVEVEVCTWVLISLTMEEGGLMDMSILDIHENFSADLQ